MEQSKLCNLDITQLLYQTEKVTGNSHRDLNGEIIDSGVGRVHG